jgi:hypothetical protein
MTINELLEIAWSLYAVVEDKGDLVLSDLLEGVQEQHGEKIRKQIQYLLEVECNICSSCGEKQKKYVDIHEN